ncbi:MAG: magnesium transporter CorA family protein [Propionibacteriaceae bacterium]|nr:magnesium transporter CorA family protein [Propionibacteriaceae bacterium]
MSATASSVLTSAVWRGGMLTDEHLEVPPAPRSDAEPGRLAWIDLCAPTHEQLAQLAQLGIDEHALEDALAPGERPKAVRYDGYTFTSVYAVRLDGHNASRLDASRISTLSLPGCLVTIRRDDSFDMTAVVRRWAEDADLVHFGVPGLLHGLLDTVVDQQFDVLQQLDDELESLTDVLFADNPDLDGLQRRMFATRRDLVRLRRVVTPMRDVVATLMRETMLATVRGRLRRDGTGTSLMSYYEDLNDHVLRAAEWCDDLRDLVASVFDTNLSLNDKRMNEIMKKLTSVAAILAVPTLISGCYGMNVIFPGVNTVAGFAVAATLIVVGVVVLFIVFRRKDWL